MTLEERDRALSDLASLGFGGSITMLSVIGTLHLTRCAGSQTSDLATADRQSRRVADFIEARATSLADGTMLSDPHIDAEVSRAMKLIAALFRLRATRPTANDFEALKSFVSFRRRAEKHLEMAGRLMAPADPEEPVVAA